MKKITTALKLSIPVILVAVVLNGCLIKEVDQTATVQAGGEFTTKVTITDITADANPHEGALCILTPSDWEFVSGTFDSQVGAGNFKVDTAAVPVYGNVDEKLPPPSGMKWIKLLSDAAYANPANVIHEATLKLKVGQTTGDYNIGYLTTKNSVDLLASLNASDTDNDNAWADTSMNHKVTVTPATAIDDEPAIPSEFSLKQNYPNPFNPSTVISFSLPEQSNVKLTVYNSIGQEIAVLVDAQMSAGNKNVQFNAANLSSGIYYYKLETGNFTETKKMLLMK